MKLELQRVDWSEVFCSSSSALYLHALLNVEGNLKKSLKMFNFKICPLTKADSQKINIYMDEQTNVI